MSNGGRALDAPVVRRIRTLTIIAWVLGLLCAVSVVWNALADLDILEGVPNPLAVDDPDASPWERADPAVLSIAEDGTLEIPAGGGVLRLDRDTETPILQLKAEIDPADWIDVAVTPEGEDSDDEYFYPDDLGDLYSRGDVVALFTGERDLEVWFETEAAETLQVSPLEATPITASESGVGDATLLYEGEHISAHAVHRGDGIFYIDTFMPSGSDSPVIEAGDVDVRFAWPEGGPVVIRITSEGAWTVEIEGEQDDQ